MDEMRCDARRLPAHEPESLGATARVNADVAASRELQSGTGQQLKLHVRMEQVQGFELAQAVVEGLSSCS
jgi:hypothetical protein